ncbi:ATP synthase F0 subunit B [Chloroflexota bacterium]
MENRTRRLWGQEIDLVKAGLAEDQVVSFISELVHKYKDLAMRQEHFLSLGAVSERAAREADKLAEDKRARAGEESAIEKEKTIAQANQKAQEMIVTARKTAQEVVRSETEDILQSAQRKGAIIEAEAKQRSQLFLIKAKAAIEDQLKEELHEVYQRLLSALRNIQGEGDGIEVRWRGKLVELWNKEGLEPGEHEVVPLVMAAEITKGPSLNIAGREDETVISGVGLMEKREEVLFESLMTGDASTPVDTGKEKAGQFPSAEQATQWLNALAPEELKPIAGESPQEHAEPDYVAIVSGEEHESLQGSGIDLHLIAPVQLSVASKVYAELHTHPEIEILRTVGSYDEGTTITVLSKKSPEVLVDMLAAIPGVEVDQEHADRLSIMTKGNSRKGNGGSERITIPVRTLG